MKLLFLFAATATAIGCCSAFTATNHLAPSFVDMSQLRMSSLKEGEEEPAAADTPQATTSQPSVAAVTSSPPGEVLMSTSLPFLERPSMLDGSLVGDVGFDPLGFAQTPEDLAKYRESEIKHARLAMLAAAGWPLSELFDKPIANAIHMNAIVDATHRAPSLLNGGLGKISPFYWATCLLAAGAIDMYGIARSKEGNNIPNYFAGNLGFDPLGLYPNDAAAQERMRLAEIKNGRLAMIAVTAFAFQEFVSKLGVVDETPFFFKPIGTVLHEFANQGYIVPN